ncbi:Uncharacterised protein [Mycobacteroides abscessus subsp. abscessus]|nr:Uncharacterised protein [Mycobacteroides abscessus subsp. abscessus]
MNSDFETSASNPCVISDNEKLSLQDFHLNQLLKTR